MTWTAQQLTAAGFSVVLGVGERVQLWRGPDPNLPSTGPLATAIVIDCVWDSISGRRKLYRQAGMAKLMLPVLSSMVVLWDVIQAVPGSVLTAQQKAALGNALLDSLDED